MSEALSQLAQRLRRPLASLGGLDVLSEAQISELQTLIDAASERERRRVQSQLRRGIFWPLRWLLQHRQHARTTASSANAQRGSSAPAKKS